MKQACIHNAFHRGHSPIPPSPVFHTMFAVTKNPLGSQVQITSDQRGDLGNPNYDYKVPDSPETKKKRKIKNKNKKNKTKRRRDKRRNKNQNLNSEIPKETIIEFRKTFDRKVGKDSSSENEFRAPRQRSFLEYSDYDYDLHPLGQREEVPQDVSSSTGDGIAEQQVAFRWQLLFLTYPVELKEIVSKFAFSRPATPLREFYTPTGSFPGPKAEQLLGLPRLRLQSATPWTRGRRGAIGGECAAQCWGSRNRQPGSSR